MKEDIIRIVELVENLLNLQIPKRAKSRLKSSVMKIGEPEIPDGKTESTKGIYYRNNPNGNHEKW